MKLYDLKLQNGKFVDTLTRGEIMIMKRFGLTQCRFYTVLNNGYLLDDKYWIDDSEEDFKVNRHNCKDLFHQFDEITRIIRRVAGWEN